VKLGLRVSPRTIRKYLPKLPATPPGNSRRDQRWSTFLKNHAEDIIACDFCVVASAAFRILKRPTRWPARSDAFALLAE